MIYSYTIPIMQGPGAANHPTGSTSEVALKLPIAISAIATGRAPEGFRCQLQHGDIRLRGSRSNHEFAGQLWLQEEEGE